MVRSATAKLNLIETHVKLNMQIGNHKIHESPREVGFSRTFLWADIALVDFTSCFGYSANN